MPRLDDADKIVTGLFVALVIGAGIFAHINQQLRVDIAKVESERLRQPMVIGWVRMDQETKQLYCGEVRDGIPTIRSSPHSLRKEEMPMARL